MADLGKMSRDDGWAEPATTYMRQTSQLPPQTNNRGNDMAFPGDDMAQWSDEQLRDFIERFDVQMDGLRDAMEEAQEILDARHSAPSHRFSDAAVADSMPYLEEALAYLRANGYEVVEIQGMIGLPAEWWRCAIVPPIPEGGFVPYTVFDGPSREKGLTRAAMTHLGHLGIWHERREQEGITDGA